jgi:hypothetical protein
VSRLRLGPALSERSESKGAYHSPVASRALLLIALLAGLAGYGARPVSQSLLRVTSPVEEFGVRIGDDYFLATFNQLERYWKKVDAESDRVELVSIGQTEEGRSQWMAVVSAPENMARLENYKAISRRLALGEVSLTEARALARDGKAVVWINGGLHADEVLGAQQLIQLVYELASADDEETLRFLRDVIVLVAHANPDGHALVADWYMREREPLQRSLEGVPRSYQKYIGHDNNRDFFLSSQAETININRVLYKEWFPQIVFDHHQPGPPGTVMFAPPFGGPANPVVDALIPATLDLVGSAMQARFAEEGKRGVTTRAGANYSMWWNGGLRTSAYFHNQVGLLTETTGDPTPIDLPKVANRLLVTADLPLPIAPQRWHFRQAVEYSMTANRAVLDFASRSRETLLMNAYTMARNAMAEPVSGSSPRGYILPSTQPDFPTATKFVDALLKSGTVVLRATEAFRVNAVTYPAGSLVVKTAQPFRAHVIDMFEPQRYPGDQPPYDIAGWTLAMQMGVRFDRVFTSFDGPFERIERVGPPARRIDGAGKQGFLISHRQNDSAIVVNRLLREGASVLWLRNRAEESIYVRPGDRAREILDRGAQQLGVSVTATSEAPTGRALRLRPPRVALWDRYGGAASSGWIRWLLERYEFPFVRVYAPGIDGGELAGKYDVLILPDEAELQRVDRTPITVPAAYRDQTGVLSADRSIPALRQFVEAGGTIVLIGQASRMAGALGAGVERVAVGDGGPSVPGSILRVHVDNTSPLGFGIDRELDVFFDNGPFFRVTSEKAAVVAWFGAEPLRSGWANGQHHLAGGAAAIDAPVGRGRVLVFGPHVAFRAQSHATFKFLFNAIYSSKTEPHSFGELPGR